MAFTLDQIRDFSSNPQSIAAPGSYGEGRVFYIADMIRTLKSEIKNGNLSVNDYFDLAEPLLGQARSDMVISTRGSRQANAINPGWQQLRDLGAIRQNGSDWEFALPISSREYANLPENVLPTQQDVQSGRIPIDLLPPVQRYRPATPTQPGQPGQPQVNPGTGGPGQPPITQIPDPANPGQFINVPLVGDPLANGVPRSVDQSVIEAEAGRQAEQSRQAFEAERSIRSQRLGDLAGLLTQEENRKFSLAQPEIFEDLNTRGLLRSSGLGEALAREKSKLAGESANVLSQQGLTDRDSEITGIKDILARTQQFQTSGLERKFTIEDWEREAAKAKELGSNYAPSVKGGTSVLSGILGGAGAAAGAAGAASGNPFLAGAGALASAAGSKSK